MTDLEILMDDIFGSRKAGEYDLKQYLRKQGNIVEDVTNNPDYWSKDIDFIVNHITSIECKWDGVMADTGNIFIELCSNIDTNKEGWYNFCQADWLYYGDAKNRVFYIFAFGELKNHIEANKDSYSIGYARDYDKEKNITKVSKGYKVPLASLEGLYTTIEV